MMKVKAYLYQIRRYWILIILVAIVFAALLWGPTVYFNLVTRSERYDLNRTPAAQVPAKDVAIVFGAGVYANGKPTPYLQWRVETAVQLYKADRIKKILMTGDNSTDHYNEPVAMQKLAISLGVPSKDIVLDYAGYSTYDSCYRAQAIFRVKSAIAVTQGYHLPRAVLACQKLGVPTIGVNAEHNKGRSWGVGYIIREWLSTDKAVVELILNPQPAVLGNSEPLRL